MHHEPVVELGADYAQKKKSKLGLWFFFLYFLFYAGFVIIGVFNYELLAKEVIGGVNIALLYGIGLIVFAVLSGILYNYFCSRYEDNMNEKEVKS